MPSLAFESYDKRRVLTLDQWSLCKLQNPDALYTVVKGKRSTTLLLYRFHLTRPLSYTHCVTENSSTGLSFYWASRYEQNINIGRDVNKTGKKFVERF